MSDDLYRDFGDLLHEVPEAEDALARWKRERALKTVRRVVERDRQARVDAAWDALLARHRKAEPLH